MNRLNNKKKTKEKSFDQKKRRRIYNQISDQIIIKRDDIENPPIRLEKRKNPDAESRQDLRKGTIFELSVFFLSSIRFNSISMASIRTY